jgi:hypothetical protein
MRKLATRVYLRGFGIVTALIALGLLAQSAIADTAGPW